MEDKKEDMEKQMETSEIEQEDDIIEEGITNDDTAKEKEVEIVDDKASEYLERLQRLMAEFDNYRKRSEKERAGLYDLGVSSTVTELLPIVDNFERALAQETEDQQFAEGIQMIYKQLTALFQKLGVEQIEAEGQCFDPELHSAIMKVEDSELGEGVISKEHQKGYKYKDKVIRHSMVTVAN
ncbi:MAG: nucleotide exchange factor GrpE [Cellulosilyticaceae bacterium]